MTKQFLIKFPVRTILLVQELSADLLLVDDKKARPVAVDLGISIIGTLGILDRTPRKAFVFGLYF